MTSYRTNPSGRLFVFFDKLNNAPRQNNAAEEVSAALGCDWPDDWAKVMRVGDALSRDYKDLVNWLTMHPKPRISDVLPQVAQAQAPLARFPDLGANNLLEWFLEGFDNTGLMALKWLSPELIQERSETPVDQRVVDKLVKDVTEFIAAVQGNFQAGSLDREYLETRLEEILDALRFIDSIGIGGVEQVYDRLIGSLLRDATLMERLRDSPILRDFIKIILALDLVLNGAANLQALAGADDACEISPPATLVFHISQVNINHVDLGLGPVYIAEYTPPELE